MVCITNLSKAQNNNTSSPFSVFGVGELSNYSTGRSNTMGGTSIGMRFRDQINPVNPASYSARDSMSMVFEMGFSGKQTRFVANDSKNNTNDSNFDYIALSFRIHDGIALAFGLQPYSNKGYSASATQELVNSNEATTSYIGDGSITKFFMGTGVKLMKNLSLGFNANYYFGNLSDQTVTDIKDPTAADTYNQITNRIRGIGFETGLQYQFNLKNNKQLVLGAVANLQSNLKREAEDFRYSQTYVSTGTSTTTVIDTISYSKGDQNDVKIPLGLGVGVSYINPDKLTIAADLFTQDWSSFENIGLNNANVQYTRKTVASAGVEWIPEKFSLKNYFKRVSYRAGVKMENDYFTYNNNNVRSYAVTAGFGLPIARQRSTLNVGIEFGTKGSVNNTLIRQDYTKLYISFALHDYWFFKRKIE